MARAPSAFAVGGRLRWRVGVLLALPSGTVMAWKPKPAGSRIGLAVKPLTDPSVTTAVVAPGSLLSSTRRLFPSPWKPRRTTWPGTEAPLTRPLLLRTTLPGTDPALTSREAPPREPVTE